VHDNPHPEPPDEMDEVDHVDIANVPVGALTIDPDQQFWTLEQRAVLRAMGVSRACSNAELAAFLHLCQRRKLDPFLRQVYLIGRYSKKEGRWVFTPQTSIDGFRVIARRAADKAGIDYSYEDPTFYDTGGREFPSWIWRMPPAAVRFVVVRNGRRFPALARYEAYVQRDRDGNPTGMWPTMPDQMLLKCAEALGLRMAFPEDLGGLYTVDEMEQADNPQPPEGATVIQGTAENVDGSDDVGQGGGGQTPQDRHAAPAPAPAGSEPEPGPDDPIVTGLLNRVLGMLATCQITTPEQGLMTLQLLTGKRLAHSTQLTNRMGEELVDTLAPIVASGTPHTDLQTLLRARFAQTMAANKTRGDAAG
jgi:phage recombination protein Bet